MTLLPYLGAWFVSSCIAGPILGQSGVRKLCKNLNMQLATLQAQLIAEKQRVERLERELANAHAVLHALGLRP